MNAYELAKYLEDDFQIQEGVIDMLREQADRIAELEKQLQESAMHNISVTSQADEHYAKVKELAQKLSAYIVELELQKAMVQDLEKEIKRLAPQTKPLSDEEIWALSEEFVREKQNILLFARAIEERHGIK